MREFIDELRRAVARGDRAALEAGEEASSARAVLRAAALQAVAGDFAGAAAAVEAAAVEAAADEPVVEGLAGQFHLRAGAVAAALPLLTRGAAVDGSAALGCDLARARAAAGDAAGAAVAIEAALAGSGDVEAAHAVVEAGEAIGGAAAAAVAAALAAPGASAALRVAAAWRLLETGDAAGGARLLDGLDERSLRLAERARQAELRARMAEAAGRPAEAVALCLAALRAEPALSDAARRGLRVAEALGDGTLVEEVIASIDSGVLRLDPALLLGAARAQAARGDREAAAETAERVLSLPRADEAARAAARALMGRA